MIQEEEFYDSVPSQVAEDVRRPDSIAQLYASGKRVIDNLQTLIDCDSFLVNIERKLRGERLDPNTGEYSKVAEPLMNDQGVEAIMTELNFRINSNFILTNFKPEDVFRIAKEVRLSLINLIYLNGSLYGIDPSMRTNVVLMIDHEVFAMLKRSENKTTINLLQQTITRVENQISELRNRGGMFGMQRV